MSLLNTLSSDFRPRFERLLNSRVPMFDFRSNRNKALDSDALISILNKHNPLKTVFIATEMSNAISAHAQNKLPLYRYLSVAQNEAIFKDAINRHSELAVIWSVSPSGYVRERAIKSITKISGSFELALLLVRLNDWVSPVRSVAKNKIEELVSQGQITPEHIHGCMGLILSMPKFGRMTPEEIKVVKKLLETLNQKSTIISFIINSTEDLSPKYLQLGLRQGLFGNDLEIIASNAKHDRARWIAVRTLLSGHYTWKENKKLQTLDVPSDVDLVQLSATVLDDPSPASQRLALDYIIEKKPPSLYKQDTFNRFSLSKHVSLLDRAEFGLRKLGISMVDEARSAIQSPQGLSWATKILGRFGTKEDGELLFNLSQTQPIEEKVSILGAAAQRNNKSAIRELELIATGNSDELIAKSACRILNRIGNKLDFQTVFAALTAGENAKGRGYLLFVPRYPTIELARIIVAMNRAGLNENYNRLFWLLSRKRNTGAFIPLDAEIEALMIEVRDFPDITERLENILGIKLK